MALSQQLAVRLFTRSLYAIVFSILEIGAAGAQSGSCEDPYGSDSFDFRFELKSTTKDKRGDFVGEFEIENLGFGKEIILVGTIEKGAFRIDYPEIEMEYMDLNGEWEFFLHMPGTFLGSPDTRRLGPGAKTTIIAQLPRNDSLALGGYKFGAFLRLSNPAICIRSKPFVVIQQRGPVEGFKSEVRPGSAIKRDVNGLRAP